MTSNGIECALIIPRNSDTRELFIIQNSTLTVENAKFFQKGDIPLIIVSEWSLFHLSDDILGGTFAYGKGYIACDGKISIFNSFIIPPNFSFQLCTPVLTSHDCKGLTMDSCSMKDVSPYKTVSSLISNGRINK